MKGKYLTVCFLGMVTIFTCYSATKITSSASEYSKYVDSNQNTNNIISSTTPTYNSNNTTSTPIITKKPVATKKPIVTPKPSKSPSKAPSKEPITTKAPVTTKAPIATKDTSYINAPIRIPTIYSVSAPGTTKLISSDSNSVIDISNMSKGYIAIKYCGSNNKVKVQIKHNSIVYNYDLASDSKYDYYPLQLGNGSYTINVLENLSGTKYKILQSEEINVSLSNPNSVYLYPNQYVWFTQSSNIVRKSAVVCRGKNTTIDKISAIFKYVTSNIKYDYYKAKNVKSGYLPDVDKIISSGKGICFDYAAVFAAMCRAQGIPTKLVTGYVAPEGTYHAWNEVYTKDKGWITVSFYLKNRGFNIVDPTFYSNMDDKEAAKYIGNGNNYKNYHIY